MNRTLVRLTDKSPSPRHAKLSAAGVSHCPIDGDLLGTAYHRIASDNRSVSEIAKHIIAIADSLQDRC